MTGHEEDADRAYLESMIADYERRAEWFESLDGEWRRIMCADARAMTCRFEIARLESKLRGDWSGARRKRPDGRATDQSFEAMHSSR